MDVMFLENINNKSGAEQAQKNTNFAGIFHWVKEKKNKSGQTH